MKFDPCEHKIRQIVIKAGKIIRLLKGLPEENNITTIYRETAPLLGLQPIQLSSKIANSLPTIEESAREDPNSPLVQICPKCGKKSYVLHPICKGCKDSEDGKYKTIFQCFECKHEEKSKEPMVVWLDRLGIDFRTQSKKSLGIKTMTDNGLK